jgi:hypothetical protein
MPHLMQLVAFKSYGGGSFSPNWHGPATWRKEVRKGTLTSFSGVEITLEVTHEDCHYKKSQPAYVNGFYLEALTKQHGTPPKITLGMYIRVLNTTGHEGSSQGSLGSSEGSLIS